MYRYIHWWHEWLVICQNVFFVKISIFVRFTRVFGNIKFFLLLFGVKQQSLTSWFIYQTLFLVVFEYFYDVYLFEIRHVCKLNWPKRKLPREVLSFSVRRLLSITFILIFDLFLRNCKTKYFNYFTLSSFGTIL